MDKIILSTPRLELQPLSREELSWYLHDEDRFARGVGPVSRAILTDILERAILMKLDKMAALPPEDQPWVTYWLMRRKDDRYGIGLLGFKGAPDYVGQVEIGYGVDPEHRNQGYTTEAAAGLIQWAFADPRVQRVIAPGTRKDNPASNRILAKLGFKVYQESDQAYSWALDRSDYSCER